MVTNKSKTALVALLTMLAACEVKGPDGTVTYTPNDPAAPAKKPNKSKGGGDVAAPEDNTTVSSGGGTTITPVTPVDNTTPPPALSALKNWGYLVNEELPVDFSALQLGVQKNFNFHQFEAGYFPINGHEIRWCVGKIKIEGTLEAGTVTISDMDMAWSIDPTGDQHSPYCTNFNGVYNFTMNNSGLELNGVLYHEVN